MRDGFFFQRKWIDYFKHLSPDEAVDLLTSLYDYTQTEEYTAHSQVVEIVMTGIAYELRQHKNERTTSEYKAFRNAVLKRDGYCCRVCGSDEDLQVHHILSYRDYPEERTRVSNGVALCAKCHREEHRRYGR